MTVELLRWPQPDRLADHGEAISSATIGEAFTTIRNEKRLGGCPEKPVPLVRVFGKPNPGAVGNRQKPGLAEFPLVESHDSVFQIDVSRIQRKRLAYPLDR